MHILIVDDEAGIREMIKKYAVFGGHTVSEAINGMQAVEMCRKSNSYDIIIMDVMMPELDGFSAVKEIRKSSRIPVIMLSARGEEYDRIHGFELGIDDYVVKPFSPRELIMRLEAIIRRGAAAEKEAGKKRDIFTYQGLKVDFDARMVFIYDHKIEMSPKEYDLFFYLIKNRGLALTREKLISDVWGYDYYGDDRTLDTHIKLVRKSIEPYQHCLVTLRGVGYRFEV